MRFRQARASVHSAGGGGVILLRTLGVSTLLQASDRPVVLSSKPLALLAFLAVARPRGPHRRDLLLALFYPESDTSRGRMALRRLVLELREAAGHDILLSLDREQLQLDRSVVDCDVWKFEDALATRDYARAVDVYGGPFLAGFHVADNHGFDEWLSTQRSRLQREFAAAVEHLALEATDRRDPQAAAAWWRRLLEHQSHDSRATLGLMQSLALTGDLAGALQAAREHARRLREELDAEPSPEVESLAAELQNGRRVASATGPVAPRSAGGAPQSPTEPARLEHLSDGTAPSHGLRDVIGGFRRIAVSAGILGVATLGAFGLVRYRASTSWRRVPLDRGAVAIMPFTATGVDSALATLDEGVIDFLYPVLSSEGGLRAVEPGSLLLALADRRARGTWAAADAPVRLAADFHAGQLIEGRVAQVGKQVALSAWLRRVPDGATVASQSVVGSRDSLYVLIRRLAVGLLGDQLGESADIIASLMERPQGAVTAYLAGVRALRAGRYPDALRSLNRALDLDSTFALAALRLAQARLAPSEGFRVNALRVARRYRASLTIRERAALTYRLVFAGVDTVATIADMLAAARAWVNAAPDDAEAWVEYAANLRCAGTVVPIPDWAPESRRAFEQGWALDSTTPHVVSTDVDWALWTEDLPWLRRVGRRYAQVADTLEPGWAGNRWVIALALGDSEEVRALRARAAAGDGSVANWHTVEQLAAMEQALGAREVDSDMLRARLSSGALTRLDSARTAHSTVLDALRKGRTRQLIADLSGPRGLFWGGRQGRQVFLLTFWLMYPGLDSAAAVAAESVRVMAETAEPGGGARWVTQRQYLRCLYLLYRAKGGDTAGVRTEARSLMPWFVEHNWVGVCPALVEALVESHDAVRAAAPALDRLEGLLRRGTDNAEFPTSAAVPLLVRLLRQRGEVRRALAAARIRTYVWSFDYQRRVAMLKEQGDLARIAGDTADAIEAYRRYLAIRSDPDELARPQVDSIRLALNGLTLLSR